MSGKILVKKGLLWYNSKDYKSKYRIIRFFRKRDQTQKGYDMKKNQTQKGAPVKAVPPVAPKAQSAAPAEPPVQAAALTGKDKAMAGIFGLLLFFAMTIQTGRVAVILSGLAALSALWTLLRRRGTLVPSLALIGFTAYGFVVGAASVWSPFEVGAIAEFYKFLAAFSLAVILLTRFEKKHMPLLLWSYAAAGTGVSLLCLDLDSARWVFTPFNAFSSLLDATYDHLVDASTGIRLTGLYNNANVNACIAGAAALLALYLLMKSEKHWAKLLAALMVGLDALTFLLFVSRGAILFFGLACLVWIIAAGKERRLSVFFHMAACALPTLALSYPAMTQIGASSPMPLLLALVNGVLIFAVDLFLVSPLTAFFGKHMKAGIAAVAVLAVAAAVVLGVAMTRTGPVTLTEGQFFDRQMRLEPGTHTITMDADEDVTVTLLLQNRREWQVGDAHDLLTAVWDGEPITFEMPDEEDVVVLFRLSGEDGKTVRAAAMDGKEIKLDYPLLPSSIAARMGEGFLTGNSFRNRLQFMADGMKIWLSSPLVGRGLGSTEELSTAYQPFFYESKFVHNQVVQVLADLGLLGLAAFLCFVGGSLWLLLRRRRETQDDLTMLLLALWVLLVGHSLMELNFNIRAFQCYAYGLLLLPALAFGKPVFRGDSKSSQIRNRLVSQLLVAALMIHTALFCTLVSLHRWVDKDEAEYTAYSYYEFLDRVKLYYDLDVYCRETNMGEFIPVALTNDTTGKYLNTVNSFVAKLERMHTYSSLGTASARYYLPLERWDDVFRCSREGMKHEASNEEAWTYELNYLRTTVLSRMGRANVDIYLEGISTVIDQYVAHNEQMLVPVELDETNAAFVQACTEAVRSNLHGDELFEYLCAAAGIEAPEEEPEDDGEEIDMENMTLEEALAAMGVDPNEMDITQIG